MDHSFWFFDTGFLCVALAGTHSVDQAGLELRNPPASASQLLGLKMSATTARHGS
jgi:biotin carboxylase